MKNKLALVTGSFDPITVGHADIARRAAALFDNVIVLVAQNEEKNYMFTAEERAEIARAAFEDVANISVDICSGYVADYAKVTGAVAFVRGIRNGQDFAYEQDMAERNFGFCGRDTVLLPTKAEYHAVSSTVVREKLLAGESAEGLVPPKSLERICEFLCRSKMEKL